MKVTRTSLFAVLAAAALALVGCTGQATETESTGGTLTVNLPTPLGSLNPAEAASGGAELFFDLAYSSLIHAGPNGQFTPALAEDFEYVGTDNTSFKLILRPDLKFADGSPLDAAALKAHIEYFHDEGGPFSNALDNLESIETPDERTVVLNLSVPHPDLPLVFSEPSLAGAVIGPAGLEDPDALGTETHGAGPYLLDEERTASGSRYVLVPNENYYDPEAQRWDDVVINVIADQNASLQSVISGQSQWTQGSHDQIAAAEAAGLNVGHGQASMFGLYLQDRAGVVTPALADERVRQALNFAVDRDAVSEVIGGKPLSQIVPEGSIGYNPAAEDVYSYDLDQARKLLDEAGYADGFTFSVIVGAFDPLSVRLAEMLAEQYAAVGVTLEISTAPTFADYGREQESGKYSSTVFAWGGASMFSVAQNLVLPSGIINPFNSNDDELNSLFDKAASLPGDEGVSAWEDFSLLVTDKAWFVPVTGVPTVYFSPSDIDPTGDGLFYPNPLFF